MRKIIELEPFRKEIEEFPAETREDIFSLIYRYLNGERLNRTVTKNLRNSSTRTKRRLDGELGG